MAISKAEMWVQFATAAVARYVVPEEVEDADELVDDMSEVATQFADQMLDEYDERFLGGTERKPKTRKRKHPAQTED
jgi:predicted site-specific integrase-resolvase